ncbi:MAG: hypothetical protein ACOCP2_02520 [Halohasta sp.]
MVSATVLQMSALQDPTLWIAAFAGGAFGAAIGALPAFIFTGFAVIAGEALGLAGEEIVDGGSSITASIGFGPVFGPHISFAAGAAAAAYAAKQGYLDDGKNILWAAGTNHVDVLMVGAVFGLIGHAGTSLLNEIAFPTDNIAMLVFISALIHRVAFGYSIIGEVTGSGLFDVGPWERDEENAPGIWLGHQYKWGNVAFLGLIGGILGAFIWQTTGSTVLSFGISAASLLFLHTGTDVPVTHHITLPGSVGALGAAAAGYPGSVVLIVGGLFGVFGATMGEVCNRVFYMHGKTHVDPPAFGILMSGLLSAVLTAAGVLGGTFWADIPTFLGA